jgi:hypothetical protein
MFFLIKLGFQPTEKKKSNGVISGLHGGGGVRLKRETSHFSWVAAFLEFGCIF